MLLQDVLSLEEIRGQREGKLTRSVAPATLLGRRKVVEEAGRGDKEDTLPVLPILHPGFPPLHKLGGSALSPLH